MADRLGKLDHLQGTPTSTSKGSPASVTKGAKASERTLETLGEASRISGVSPSDLNVLMVYLGR